MAATGFTASEVYLLHEITTRLDRIARKEILEPRGITYPEFLVLMVARESPSPTQEEVGAYVDMSSSLVSQRVAALTKKGLLRQETDRDNRRRVRLSLTHAGASAVTHIYDEMVKSSGEIFAKLGTTRPAFRRALALLVKELGREQR